MIDAADGKKANPAHGNINSRIKPFWGVDPDGCHNQTGKSKPPYNGTQCNALLRWKYQKTNWGIASGNQKINHDMI